MLALKTYFVREHVGLLKLHEAFDILDPESGEIVATAVEEAGPARKLLKLVVSKRMLPFKVVLRDVQERTLLVIERGFTFLRSRVRVLDPSGRLLGSFRQRLLTIGGRFDILDADDRPVAELKGNLIGWDFKFLDGDGRELGRVTKKWAGVGKELFTSADNYVVSLADGTDPKATGPLLLAAAISIDLVLKESG
ncbi:MAG: oxidoreductase [Candidatus Dadabacteria bacterium]|nr:MAG: oxidoreductase [Candidatus Dadabacteria bacterium]